MLFCWATLDGALSVRVLRVLNDADAGVSIGRAVALRSTLFVLLLQGQLLLSLDNKEIEDAPQDIGQEVASINQPQVCHSGRGEGFRFMTELY